MPLDVEQQRVWSQMTGRLHVIDSDLTCVDGLVLPYQTAVVFIKNIMSYADIDYSILTAPDLWQLETIKHLNPKNPVINEQNHLNVLEYIHNKLTTTMSKWTVEDFESILSIIDTQFDRL